MLPKKYIDIGTLLLPNCLSHPNGNVLYKAFKFGLDLKIESTRKMDLGCSVSYLSKKKGHVPRGEGGGEQQDNCVCAGQPAHWLDFLPWGLQAQVPCLKERQSVTGSFLEAKHAARWLPDLPPLLMTPCDVGREDVKLEGMAGPVVKVPNDYCTS